jgi:hypothetical protein
MTIARRVLTRYVEAATKTLDLSWVESLRKDFLALMKNLPRVKDYDTAHQLRAAFTTYRERFEEMFFMRFLHRDLKENYEKYGISKSDSEWLWRKLGEEVGPWAAELRLPIDFATDYWNTASRYAQFEHDWPKWEARVRRRSQVAWKAIREAIEWIERNGKKVDVTMPDVDQANIEGFRVQIRGYNPAESYGVKGVEIFKQGLRIYRHNAAARFPLLLKKQCPIILECDSSIDKAGEYNYQGLIIFHAWGVSSETPARAAHILAHEMGHHLFRTYLSGDARTFWEQTIQGDYGDIDLKELLDRWPGDAWAFDMPSKMKDDPLLALQVAAYSGKRENESRQSKADFQELYDQGIHTLRVPKTPITGYAGKNAEEAFCEAVGLLVAYGPRAVHERIRWWLDTVLSGQVKVARRS